MIFKKITGSLRWTNFLRASIPFQTINITQGIMNVSPQPRSFILDFDGTITSKDTIGLLGEYGVSFQSQRGVDMKRAWEDIVEKYDQDFSRHVGQHESSKAERRTLDREIQYYRGLKEIEERSFGRVSSSGLFKGITEDVWEDAGEEAVKNQDVIVREGFEEFVEKVKTRGGIWGIVSVNFSSYFIRGVIRASAGSEKKKIEILANIPDKEGVLIGPKGRTGLSGNVIATSDAKLASAKDLRRRWSDIGSRTSMAVYIGDSGTDIECLTEPDIIGIIIAGDGQSSLMETMKRIGVEVVHIGEYQEESRHLYWARDFTEIARSRLC